MLFQKKKKEYTLGELRIALEQSWDWDTAYGGKWPPPNPERFKGNPYNQCFVTALVLRDYFGGEILHSTNPIHFWNQIDGEEVDLTREQFDKFEPEFYLILTDLTSYKTETTDERYKILKRKVKKILNEG